MFLLNVHIHKKALCIYVLFIMKHYALFHYSLIYECGLSYASYEFVIECNHIMLDWMRFWVGVLESALEGFFLYMSKSSFSVAASGPLPFLLSAVYRRVLCTAGFIIVFPCFCFFLSFVSPLFRWNKTLGPLATSVSQSGRRNSSAER